MWIPSKVVELLSFNKDELVKYKTERDLLKDQLTKSEIMCDWLRMRVNSLEAEKSVLMNKAYDVRLPAPELHRKSTVPPDFVMDELINFDGIPFTPEGDRLAEKLGIA